MSHLLGKFINILTAEVGDYFADVACQPMVDRPTERHIEKFQGICNLGHKSWSNKIGDRMPLFPEDLRNQPCFEMMYNHDNYVTSRHTCHSSCQCNHHCAVRNFRCHHPFGNGISITSTVQTLLKFVFNWCLCRSSSTRPLEKGVFPAHDY